MQLSDPEYKKVLTDIIQKQIVILGPTITLAKARNVKALSIADDGTVTAISGNAKEAAGQLVDQFMELSEFIVKNTMEPLTASRQTPSSPGLTGIQPEPAPSSPVSADIQPEPAPAPVNTASIPEPIPAPIPAPTPATAPTNTDPLPAPRGSPIDTTINTDKLQN